MRYFDRRRARVQPTSSSVSERSFAGRGLQRPSGLRCPVDVTSEGAAVGHEEPRPVMRASHWRGRGLIAFLVLVLLLCLQETPISLAQAFVCQKGTPAKGDVPDPDWTFAYSSWAEPYATDAFFYFYVFENRTSHNVPVEWPDAGITRAKTEPGKPIQSSLVDAPPSGLTDSVIMVGVEGQGRRTYTRKNCFSAADTPRRQSVRARYATRFRFTGRVVGATGVSVQVDVEFTSSIFTVGFGPAAPARGDQMVDYIVSKPKVASTFLVDWDIPGLEKKRVVIPEERPLVWAQKNYKRESLSVVNTKAILRDVARGEELVVLSVPAIVRP